MKELEKIDGTPEKRLYSSIIADYDIEKALCELIDNAIDNAKNNSLPKVFVNISMDITGQSINLSDNSGGVLELRNLISPGATGNNPEKELIGLFGVGTKRATIALAKNVCIKTRLKGDNTKILKFDEDWVNDSNNWYITPYVADQKHEEIEELNTIIELTNLRKNFDYDSIKKMYDHFSKTYAFFIKDNFLELNFNDTIVSSIFFDNWSYSPTYPPIEYSGIIQNKNKSIKVKILAGLSNKSNPSGNWGVFIYCNNRLISKEIKNSEVGFGKGLAGKPHPTISLVNVLVFIEGDSSLMPWNSSKSNINYSHPVFKKIQPNLKELVIRYAKISRALEGIWTEKLFKHSSGKIVKQSIRFDKILSRELPPLPAPKSSEIIKIKGKNKKIFKTKPWTQGLFGGIEAKEIMLRKEFNEKNRFLLIILDSTIEIAFKEFLIYESGSYYSDTKLLNLFSSRHNVQLEVKKYPKGKLITKREWILIKFYYDTRCKLIHQKGNVHLKDRDLEIYSDIVKSVLKKLFNISFKIDD